MKTPVKTPLTSPPISSLAAFERIRGRVNQNIRIKEEELRKLQAALTYGLCGVENLTREFMELGVAVISCEQQAFSFTELASNPAKYFADVQRQLGKPFVLMEEERGAYLDFLSSGSQYYFSTHWHLIVPAVPRLKSIIAGLLLVGVSTDAVRNQGGETPPVVYRAPGAYVGHPVRYAKEKAKGKNDWTFYFFGSVGEELRLDWLNKCKTDPVFRVCLNVPRALLVQVN